MKVTVKSIREDICRLNIQGYGSTRALVESSHYGGYILCIPSTGTARGVKIEEKTPEAIAEGVVRLWPAIEAFWAEQAQPSLEESDWY